MTQNNTVKKKIFSWQGISRRVKHWKQEGLKIVFTNGCFDILHLGHADYLTKARHMGDILIVGLNTDASVKKLKGSTRPINNQNARATLLASLLFVDAVVLFDEDTPYNLIKLIQPDILVKGKDYKAKDVVGYDIVKARGGKIKTIALVKGYSTTAIEEHILKENNS